jgi:hypothetical protein
MSGLAVAVLTLGAVSQLGSDHTGVNVTAASGTSDGEPSQTPGTTAVQPGNTPDVNGGPAVGEQASTSSTATSPKPQSSTMVTSTQRVTSTTVKQSTSGTPGTTTTTGPTASTEPLSTTSSTIACRNSYDARCGRFHWDPQPQPGDPLTVRIQVVSSTPRSGQPVDFHVTVDDPNMPIDQNCYGKFYGDNTGGDCGAVYECPNNTQQPYGPWSPPAKNSDHYEATISHVYATPGTYTMKLVFRSKQGCENPPNPYYGTEGVGTVTVTVS